MKSQTIISSSFFVFLMYFFSLYFLFSCVFCIFLLLCYRTDPLAAAKLQSVVAEGGAGSHSRLQRCMRRARSLQQRMQLQQQKQRCDSEADKQPAEQQHQEEQKLQEQPRYHLHSAQIRRSQAAGVPQGQVQVT